MCFFKKKQVILKRTQSIAHNKIRQKASVSLCCPPCLTLLKRKKMSTGADPLPFCAVPLWDHGMKTQRVAGVRTIPAHREPRNVTKSLIMSLPLDKVQHLYMSAFQNGPPPGTTLFEQGWVTVAAPGEVHLVLIRGRVLWPRISSGRVLRRVLNFNTLKWYIYFPFRLFAAGALEVFSCFSSKKLLQD